ncbi:hypothetical protein [Streptomyces sp. NPDC001502]|uniref:hypothetical protein n=1 Tax=Streptomyces sp. NPDC001502 TaxID=3364578 RepID=UPI00369588DC
MCSMLPAALISSACAAHGTPFGVDEALVVPALWAAAVGGGRVYLGMHWPPMSWRGGS